MVLKSVLLSLVVAQTCFGQAGIASQPFLTGLPSSGALPTAGLIFWGEATFNVFNIDHVTPITNNGIIKCWSSRFTNLVADPSLTNCQVCNQGNGPLYQTNGGPQNLPYILESASGSGGLLSNEVAHNWNQSNKVTIHLLAQRKNVNSEAIPPGTPEFYDGVFGARFFLDTLRFVPVSGFEAYAGSFITGTSFTITNWTVWTVCFNGANSFLRTNGVLCVTGNTGSPGNFNGITIGGNPSDTQNGFSGGIYACIVYNGVQDTNDMQTVENYLKAKAGL